MGYFCFVKEGGDELGGLNGEGREEERVWVFMGVWDVVEEDEVWWRWKKWGLEEGDAERWEIGRK